MRSHLRARLWLRPNSVTRSPWLHASWSAIHIETTRSHRLGVTERDRISEALRLAQRLGAQAVTIPAVDAADGIVEYAQANNYTHIIIARSDRSR